MAVNVLAFLPFGFLGGLILVRKMRSVPKGTAVIILAAFFFSLSVELLQAWLPTRNSSMVDLICDVTGAAIGAWIARRTTIRKALLSLGLAWYGM